MIGAAAATTSFINADLWGSDAHSLRIEASRISALGARPASGDRVLDLGGDRIFPGLINAHDHLQLNGLPHLIYRPRYANASRWISDVKRRLESDPELIAQRALSRADRLLLGGIKNILSGVTTVAHHDPLHACLIGDTGRAAVDHPCRRGHRCRRCRRIRSAARSRLHHLQYAAGPRHRLQRPSAAAAGKSGGGIDLVSLFEPESLPCHPGRG
jgi:cytosine/adenosine deaminase-related metal-dependent hydrolase